MKYKLKTSKITIRKLKLSDFKKFKKLFFSSFKKKISYDFFKWRYFSDKHSFCYGVFDSSELIANVGMKSNILNNKNYDRVFSRHSSMVINKFKGIGIFSKLLKEVKKNFLKEDRIVLMWPNKNNFASFGIKKERIIKNNYFLYKTSNYKIKKRKTIKYNIKELKRLEIFFENNDNFFYKNLDYFKYRYLSYKKNEYLINKFEINNFKSFFILKKNRDEHGLNYIVLEHFGSKHIKSNHLFQLIGEEKKIVFWSKKKILKSNYKLINKINVHIGLIKKIDMQNKHTLLPKQNFMLGDTDSFININ